MVGRDLIFVGSPKDNGKINSIVASSAEAAYRVTVSNIGPGAKNLGTAVLV